jgi:hypothetical protein
MNLKQIFILPPILLYRKYATQYQSRPIWDQCYDFYNILEKK